MFTIAKNLGAVLREDEGGGQVEPKVISKKNSSKSMRNLLIVSINLYSILFASKTIAEIFRKQLIALNRSN